MAQAVIMPKLGQATEESTIVKWHKKEGDNVKKGDVLFEMETDKAVLEAESFFEGTLLKVLVRETETVPVNAVVAYIGKVGEAIPTAPPPPPSAAPQPAVQGRETAPPRPTTSSQAAPAPQTAAPARATAVSQAPVQPARLFISPRAKALVRSKAIDPADVKGTGPNGRIVVRDVNAYLDSVGYDKVLITPAAKALAMTEGLNILRIRGTSEAGRITVQDVNRAIKEKPVKMSKMRMVIAKRLTESFTTTPHFYVSRTADMTDLLAFRKELKDRGEDYSVTDFILEAVILSLKEFPIVNSVTEGTTVRWRGTVDLGMAVALDDGLVVPAIRNAEDLGMKELHKTVQSLAVKAREGKLLPDEMTGSSFTVSNMGMLDVDDFAAIINPGEGGILAVASTRERPVVVGGQVKIRSIMGMTVSVDHRIIDGSVAAAFINGIRRKLEDISLWKSLM
jgi:pyruvate dehydrogenase E2 component (dihydrolipoamide acetyltransferase)